jgi:hypothetical protein
LDATDQSQTDDEVEEPDVGLTEDIEGDTYSDEEHATQTTKKKKKKKKKKKQKKKRASAGQFDANTFWRTDGRLVASRFADRG